MTTGADSDGVRRYWTLAQIARELDEKPAQLLYWEKQLGGMGFQLRPRGIKRYGADEVETFRRLHYLIRAQGYSIQGACRHLSEAGAAAQRHHHLRQTLEEIRRLLLHLRENL